MFGACDTAFVGSNLSFEMPSSAIDADDIEITGILTGLKFRQLFTELLQLLIRGGKMFEPLVDKLIGLIFWSGMCYLCIGSISMAASPRHVCCLACRQR